jgi:hypothetical protein
MLALGAQLFELVDIFYGAKPACRHQNSRPVSLLRTQMGLKFNFRRIPLHWRLLVGLQLGISGVIMAYRQRVLKAKQQQE